MALNFILSQTSPERRRLSSRRIFPVLIAEGGDALSEDWSYAEPSAGAGAVALLIGENPIVFQADAGANGYYGYEVMDTCRPIPDSEAGDADLSLMSYLDCCEQTFREYKTVCRALTTKRRFTILPSIHRLAAWSKSPDDDAQACKSENAEIEQDFQTRVEPGLRYCQRVGNIMGAASLLALASTIDQGAFDTSKRIGCFRTAPGAVQNFTAAL